jgi:5-formyltetrahydrofolate cyclo-ligase
MCEAVAMTLVGGAKAVLRDRVQQEVAALAPAARQAEAERVWQCVLGLPEVASARNVVACLSFGLELDTWPLVGQLEAAGKVVWVPRSVPATKALVLHRWPCALETRRFGLREPVPTAPALAPERVDETIGCALVLGLAFDRLGYRLGHGAGYFDRFLAGRPFPAIGLAFGVQVVDELPREPHDVAMAAVVTAAGICRPA